MMSRYEERRTHAHAGTRTHLRPTHLEFICYQPVISGLPICIASLFQTNEIISHAIPIKSHHNHSFMKKILFSSSKREPTAKNEYENSELKVILKIELLRDDSFFSSFEIISYLCQECCKSTRTSKVCK